MTWSWRLVAVAGLVAEGLLLRREGAVAWALALSAAGALVLAALVVGRRRATPAAPLVVVAAAQLAVAFTAVVPPLQPAVDDERWLAATRARLAATLEDDAADVVALPERLRESGRAFERLSLADSALAAAPFTFAAAPDPVLVVLWRGDQRVAWNRNAALTPAPPPEGATDLTEVVDGWVLRHGVALPAAPGWRAELQVAVAGGDDGPRARRIVSDGRPGTVRTRGDARRGVTATLDVSLGEGHAVQLVASAPPREAAGTQAAAGRRFALLVAFAAAALAAGAALAGPVGALAAAWGTRALWASVDAVRLVAVALPGRDLPVAPTDPASLWDPAYFATRFGAGWFASGADACLTAALVAATGAMILRRWRPPAGAWVRGPGGEAAAAAFGAVAAAGLLAVRALGHEIAANANARLVGLGVPLESWTFWALHVVLLALSGGVVAALVGMAGWAGSSPASRGRVLARVGLAAVGAALVWWPAAPVAGALLGVGLLWHAPGRSGRLAAGVLGLLVVVTWNHLVLAEAYGRAEREWLRRKAEQIVRPQTEGLGFLLEDLLGELAAADAALPRHAAAATSHLAEPMWRDARAYRLWRGSAAHDLGLPCLVEVLDGDRRDASLFATGFLRDVSYEVIERGPWRDTAGGARLQDEVRRYPTGQEHVLRGEIPRLREEGWLRVELPVFSRRLPTLLAALGVSGSEEESSGYRPRREIDRPLLLMRGWRGGWLDVGFGGAPDERSERVVDDLRAGRREWGVVRAGDASWLGRWAPVPPEVAAQPGEGYLLALRRTTVMDGLLDWARLLLLDLLLVFSALAATRRWRWPAGFQGRFLAGYLGIGLVILVLAGWLGDRLTFEWLDRAARERTRDGLVTTLEQLRGLLAEQGRALASSEYIAELLLGRLAGERPQGPYLARQGMVFGPDGALLLDETLSDLDEAEAERLLAAARQSSLIVMEEPSGVYLATAIPIDLSGVLPEATTSTGTFLYRQRLGEDLLASLADLVGAELALRRDGEPVVSSHPGRFFAGRAPLLLPPSFMSWLHEHPANATVFTAATGGVGLPALARDDAGALQQRVLPAVLTVRFPERRRDFAEQRQRTALFLVGLATLLLLAAFALATALTWNIFEPLRVLLGATRRLAAGDFAAPLPPPGRDEVGRLAEGFRAMRAELQVARDRLESRERFLAAVLEHVPAGVLVWDADGEPATVNRAAAEILAGFYPDPGDDGERARRLRRALASRGDPPELELTGGGGRRTLRVRAAELGLGGDRPHRLVVCEDVSEFLATQRLALNAELARQVAHEIKNPLTPIQLSAQLAQQAHRDRHPQYDEIVEAALARILEQVALLRSIAGEFSLLGRPGDLECERVELPALVTDVVAGYGDGPRVTIAPGPVPAVRAHRASLRKVLGNLMQNSLDAAGGAARLAVEVSWRIGADTVDLRWRDNGEGVAPDVAERLFTPYFSTKSKGTGLGLAICRNLLDKMGGRIALANREDGRGAEATITLARADGESS